MVFERVDINAHTALGQQLVLRVRVNSVEAGHIIRAEQYWPEVLIACGLWTSVKAKLLPNLTLRKVASTSS